MTRFWRRLFAGILMFFVLVTLASCATIKVNTIPVPPPTAKLRIYVESFSLDQKFTIPHEKFVERQVRIAENLLKETGIYEVVNSRDVRTVIGDQGLTYYFMKKSEWAQARQIGNALYADFILIVTRDKSRGALGESVFMITTELVNVTTGKTYRSHYTFNNSDSSDAVLKSIFELVRKSHRDLFSQAKRDMLSVAVRKGRVSVPLAPIRTHAVSEEAKAGMPATQSKSVVPPPSPQKQEAPPVPTRPELPAVTPPAPAQKPEPPSEVKQQAPPVPMKDEPPMVAKVVPSSPNFSGSGLIGAPKKDAGAKKLVVYDFDTSDQYRTVALILAEVLREEVFKLKQFSLVNREDLQRVLEEMALQQTGLIDENEAVKTGKGLAADQVVTGRLGQIGKTFVMQAKRVDVETFGTLGLVSTRFTEGQEEEVLNKMPDFARNLVGLQ